MVEFTKVKKCSSKEFELIKITDDVRRFAAQSKIKNGVVYVILSHTTAGIMVNESLPCLEKDIEATLEDLVPLHRDYAHSHFLPSYGAIGGNAPGHIRQNVHLHLRIQLHERLRQGVDLFRLQHQPSPPNPIHSSSDFLAAGR